MSVTDQGSAGMPTLTVAVGDLYKALHNLESLQGYEFQAYSEQYKWRKTDLGANPATAVNASRQVLGGDVRELGGWTITETTGAAVASVRLRDGSQNTAEVLCRVSLPASGNNVAVFGEHGVEVFTGRIFIEVISGSVEGVIYWR